MGVSKIMGVSEIMGVSKIMGGVSRMLLGLEGKKRINTKLQKQCKHLMD